MSFVIAGNSASTGYNLTRSLRFRASASASLTRTMTTPTNNLKWTLSAWVKRGSVLTTENQIMNAGTAGSDDQFLFTGSSQLGFYVANGAAYYLITNAVFRDPAAWYHIVFVYDSANATAANRLLMYVNGTQVTSFATALYPTQNYASQINSAVLNRIGLRSNSASPLDGYLTEVNFIDGQALTPSSFGSTNALTGVWQPARYTGTYGTNGFYLPFTDNSALTTASNVGLGKDFSGNGNYWVTNNISITAGVTYDSMTDVPTLTSATAANFAVLNPVALGIDATLTNGNLTIAYGTAVTRTGTAASMGMTSGKYYWEITVTASSTNPCDAEIGISNTTENSAVTTGIGYYPGYTAKGWGYYGNTGDKVTNAVATAYGSTYTTNDVIGVAFDATAGSLTFYKNNTSQGVAFSSLPAGTYYPAVGDGSSAGTLTMAANFGQRPFTYTPPTGFVALNTYNLPTSTIVKGNTVMDATLWAGDNTARSITNAAAFKPDLVWIKDRTTAGIWHVWFDSVRGVGNQLSSNQTDAELASASNVAGKVSAFNSNGFSVVTGSSSYYSVNQTAENYVGWQWQAGQGSSSSNTNGTITSTVSVNASAGFSVVTYTGTGANATVGHGLGVAPSFIVCKARSTTGSWQTYHSALTGTTGIFLDLTSASFASSVYWNNTNPTSSVFSIGTSSFVNVASQTQVAYCWTPIAGFSAFGSYTGNGSTDGPFIYLGFRPRWIMFKDTGAASQWRIWDTARDPYNITTNALYANSSGTEQSADNYLDIVSNGFKIRSTNAGVNTSAGNYIYMAYAENPFKNALAR
jgi:hypothetical protein